MLRFKHMFLRPLILSFLLYNAPIQPIAPLYVKGIMTAIAGVGALVTMFGDWFSAMFWGYKLEQEAKKAGISIPTPKSLAVKFECLSLLREILHEAQLADPVATFRTLIPYIKKAQALFKAEPKPPVEQLTQVLAFIRATKKASITLDAHIVALGLQFVKSRIADLEKIREQVHALEQRSENGRTQKEDRELLAHYELLELATREPEITALVEQAEKEQKEALAQFIDKEKLLNLIDTAKSLPDQARKKVAELAPRIEQAKKEIANKVEQHLLQTTNGKPTALKPCISAPACQQEKKTKDDEEHKKKLEEQIRRTQALIAQAREMTAKDGSFRGLCRAGETITPIHYEREHIEPVTVEQLKITARPADIFDTLEHFQKLMAQQPQLGFQAAIPLCSDRYSLVDLEEEENKPITPEDLKRLAQRTMLPLEDQMVLAERTLRLQETMATIRNARDQKEHEAILAAHNKSRPAFIMPACPSSPGMSAYPLSPESKAVPQALTSSHLPSFALIPSEFPRN